MLLINSVHSLGQRKFLFVKVFCAFTFLKTVLRIWDCLFYEGSKILFRVALTLIRHNQALIAQARNLPDICEYFKQTTRGAFVEDCHLFMQVSWALATSCRYAL